MSEKQLSIGEKWEADLESARNGAKILVSAPQCERCAHYVKGDAMHCAKYTKETKPRHVMFTKKECVFFESTEPLKISLSNDAENKIYGGIFGFITADALGVPVEFSSRQERNTDPVKEMRAYGTYHQPFGAWSDDSSLMLCLIDAFNHGFSVEKLKNNMIRYYTDGAFTPEDKMFDIGMGTANAIQKMIRGVPATECGGNGERDNGNGSLMRILPLGFVSPFVAQSELLTLSNAVSSLTHRTVRSQLACYFYSVFAGQLFEGRNLNEAYDAAILAVKNESSHYFDSEKLTFRDVLHKSVIKLDRRRIRSSGYVVDTLEAVLWALFNTKSYEEAVLAAVNLGEDTDTIAALTGGLAGIYYGFDQIPQRWIQTLLKKEMIADMTGEFAKYVQHLKQSGK